MDADWTRGGGGVTSLREHLEAIRDQHSLNDQYSAPHCVQCYLAEYPCLTREHAEDALALLDAAEPATTWMNGEAIEHLRLVPEPTVPAARQDDA